ncbi:MAG: hypothetical protein Q7T54_05575 [Candidatus Levybacteria bacterium]|nr:hypothetical protein [Candidatus Levybacteria bacterium]
MSVELTQEKKSKFENLKKSAKKMAVPALVGAGIIFPASVYTAAAVETDPKDRSNEISDFLDNRQAEISEGVLLLSGVALTLNAYYTGKRYDEKKLHILRVAGPTLLTAAATTALIDSQTPINYAIPAGLALASTYALASTNIISTFERTRDIAIRSTTIAAGGALVAGGATIFLAAADKL